MLSKNMKKSLFIIPIIAAVFFGCKHKLSPAEAYIQERMMQFEADSMRLVHDINEVKKTIPQSERRRRAMEMFNEQWYQYLNRPVCGYDDEQLDLCKLRILANMKEEIAYEFMYKAQQLESERTEAIEEALSGE